MKKIKIQMIGSVILLPDRLSNFLEILKSLEYCIQIIDIIYIHIVDYYTRLNKSLSLNEIDTLKKYLETYSIPTKIIHHKKDKGPILKLLGVLPYCKEDDLIYIFDDDVKIYPMLIFLLYNTYIKYKDRAVYGLMGCQGNQFVHGEYLHENYKCVDLLGGYRGVIYPMICIHKEKFIKYLELFIDEFDKNNEIPMHDDHIFASFFKKENIERRVINIYPKLENNKLYYEAYPTMNGIFQDKMTFENIEKIKKIMMKYNYSF